MEMEHGRSDRFDRWVKLQARFRKLKCLPKDWSTIYFYLENKEDLEAALYVFNTVDNASDAEAEVKFPSWVCFVQVDYSREIPDIEIYSILYGEDIDLEVAAIIESRGIEL